MGESEALGLVEGCVLWEPESSLTGCHWWRDTAEGGSFGVGREVVAVEVEEEQVQGTTEE